MPGTSKAKNPSGIEIIFTEDDHSYVSTIDDKTVSYTSGTGFLSKYFPPFDPTGEITKRCAQKAGLTVEQIKEQWRQKGANSCRLGTRLHECCEDILLNRSVRNTPEDDQEKARFDVGMKLASKLRDSIDILGVEKIVFSHTLPNPIAGTIDLFGKSRKNNSYLILDWKTNEKIETYNTFKKYCLEPISHIPDISMYHYALQLSLYQYILIHEGYVPKHSQFQRALLHITPKGSKIIQVPDLTNEIKDLIIDDASKK